MINALHLLWIVPLTGLVSAVLLAQFVVGGKSNPEKQEAAHE